MPLREKRQFTRKELMLGLVLRNRLMLMQQWWSGDLTIPVSRTDLPKEWRGKEVISEKQRIMALSRHPKTFMCTSRKLGKSLVVEAAFIQFAITDRNEGTVEGLLYTPADTHLKQIVQRIHSRILRTPLFNTLCTTFNIGQGKANFVRVIRGKRHDFTWWMKIEGPPAQGGKNMVGYRALYALGDEGAYGFNWRAYQERQNTVLPHAMQLWVGVPNGIRTTPFWGTAETRSMGAGWFRLLGKDGFNQFINPLYASEQAQAKLVQNHGGSKSTQEYVNQVLGEWGSPAASSFPVVPAANTPFKYLTLTETEIRASLQYLPALVQVGRPPANAEGWVIGGDLGYSPDPSEITAFFSRDGVWHEWCRINMTQVDHPFQAAVIDCLVVDVLQGRVDVGVLDAHGWGAGVLAILQGELRYVNRFDYPGRFRDAGFAGMAEDPRIKLHRKCGNVVRGMADGYVCDACNQVMDETGVRPARVPSKQLAANDLKSAFAAGQRYLEELEERERLRKQMASLQRKKAV